MVNNLVANNKNKTFATANRWVNVGKKQQYAFLLFFVSAVLNGATFARADDAMLREAQECTRHLPTMERLYNIPTHWLAAIASTESGRYNPRMRLSVPWPWTINVKGQGYWFDTKQEAIAAAQRFMAQGIRSMDVGCMQVNLLYHGQAFANLNQAFEPMYNIAYAAKFLREKYNDLNSWTKATAAYHSMQSQRGADYYRKVYKKWQQVVDRLNDTMLTAPQQAWQENKLDRPRSFAYREDPPATPFHVATPSQNAQEQERVRWNSIKVTRGLPSQVSTQAAPQQVQAQKNNAVTLASNIPDSGIGGFPAEAVTPLDVLSGNPTTGADIKPTRQYERGVLVVRASPPQRVMQPAPAQAVSAAAVPQQQVQQVRPVATANMPAPVQAARGQFAPSAMAEPQEEFVDESPKPHIVRPKFIF